MLTATDYKTISDIVFTKEYPGYRPDVVESPNGDGKWDTDKRYAHISTKYLGPTVLYSQTLLDFLHTAHHKAEQVAVELGIPKAFWPVMNYSAMRILEYPPGATTHPHTDFDLFTLMMYRNLPHCFRYLHPKHGEFIEDEALVSKMLNLKNANQLNKQIHFGELMEIINPKAYIATPHEVVVDQFDRTQYSIVYFAIPDERAVLPTGQTVGDWLTERKERSRKVVNA